MKTSSRDIVAMICGLALAATAGCVPPAATSQPAGATRLRAGNEAQINACADLLHDLCADLMLYHYEHERLPEKLSEAIRPDQKKVAVCPISGKPYVYDPVGVEIPGLNGAIVYDAEPCARRSLGILMEPARPGHALVFRVIRMPPAASQPAAGQ